MTCFNISILSFLGRQHPESRTRGRASSSRHQGPSSVHSECRSRKEAEKVGRESQQKPGKLYNCCCNDENLFLKLVKSGIMNINYICVATTMSFTEKLLMNIGWISYVYSWLRHLLLIANTIEVLNWLKFKTSDFQIFRWTTMMKMTMTKRKWPMFRRRRRNPKGKSNWNLETTTS